MSSIKTFLAEIDQLSLRNLYVCFATFIGLFLIFATPPFQTPDAVNHFYRAIQISEGQWRAYHFEGTSGGRIDSNAVKFASVYEPLKGHADSKASRAMADSIRHLHWGTDAADTGFPNTAIYPAFTYVPQALAVAVARKLHMTIWSTYRVICAAGLLVSILLTAWALKVARRSALFIFAVALLPTTLMISASVSQEVSVIPLCFLVIAYFERFVAMQIVLRGRWRWFLGIVLVICVSARPPYGGLLLLLFYPQLRLSTQTGYRFWTRVALAAAIAVASAIAMEVFQSSAWIPAAAPRSVPDQAAFLLHHPAAVFKIAIETLRTYSTFYAHSFIGVLGWLDAPLAGSFYATAGIGLGFALMAVSLQQESLPNDSNAWRLTLLLPVLVTFALTFAALYLTWTPVGQWVVEGVQGRYFTAVFPLLALAMPRIGSRAGACERAARLLRQLLTLTVMVFPLYGFQQIVTTVIDRYYLP